MVSERRDIMSYARWTTKEEVVEKLEGVNLETGVKKSGTPITYDDIKPDNTLRYILSMYDEFNYTKNLKLIF